MRSQLIDIKGAGTQKYNGQGVFRTGPTPQRRCPGEQCWLLTAAGLFDEGPDDNGHDFNIPIHIFGCNLLSFSDFYTEEKAIPLSSFGYPLWLEGCSETVNQPVKQGCWQVLPAFTQPTGRPESCRKKEVLPGEMHVQESLVLTVKALLKWTKLYESTQYILCFWHFDLWRISFWNTLLWGPTVSLKKLFCRIRVNL